MRYLCWIAAASLVAIGTAGLYAEPEKPKSGSKSDSASRSTSMSRKGKHGRPIARKSYRGQTQPTADRYREIQQALAAKGYFQGESNGIWGADSTEALQRFQRDQNLKASGKLDARSLIALGLGPKREAVFSKPADPAAETPKDASEAPEK
jgi:peptidoglycan hydrolase-like protein with peptidoglycan-binding domain